MLGFFMHFDNELWCCALICKSLNLELHYINCSILIFMLVDA